MTSLGEGFRYHMTNVNASIGLSQLARIDGFIESRRATCRSYNEQLSGLDGICVPQTDYSDVSPFIYYIRVRPDWRLELIEFLRARGVATGIHFLPAHEFSFFSQCRRGPLPVTEQVCSEQVTLPLHSHMAARQGRASGGRNSRLCRPTRPVYGVSEAATNVPMATGPANPA